MTALRSWKPLGRALVAVLAVALIAVGFGAQASWARRNVDLEAPRETSQGTTTASTPAAESPGPDEPPGQTETSAPETPARRHERRARRGHCVVTLEAPAKA